MINVFDDNIIKVNYNIFFWKIINVEFDIILKIGYLNLIIDVRNNDGGNLSNGKRVLKYLLDFCFVMKRSVWVLKNKCEEDLMKCI